MTFKKFLTSAFVVACLSLQATSMPNPQASQSADVTSASTPSATVPPLSTEVGYPAVTLATTTLSASFGPPNSSTFIAFDYPSFSQIAAFESAKSLATAINSTVPFAQPTDLTVVNLYSGYSIAPVSQYRFACPSGMVGVAGRCCPGVAIGDECYVTNTSPIASYATFTGQQELPSNAPGDHDNAAEKPYHQVLSVLLGVMFTLIAGAALI